MKVVKTKEKPRLDIYIAPIEDKTFLFPLLPKEREEEIKNIKNERVKREKYSAWRLLEYALSKSLSATLPDSKLYKDENGKWHSPLFEFSISHSDFACAVVISHAPVGIDVEPVGKIFSESFANKNLTQEELLKYNALPSAEKDSFLLTRWCIKEAIFKREGGSFFAPSSINSLSPDTLVRNVKLGTNEYVCALSGALEECEPTFTIVKQL